MTADKIKKLPPKDLIRLKRINFWIFHLIMAVDLVLFYRALNYENWLLLLVSFGIFIVGLALYDNYLFTRRLLQKGQ